MATRAELEAALANARTVRDRGDAEELRARIREIPDFL